MNVGKSLSTVGVQLAQPFTAEDYDLARQTIITCCRATKRARARNAAGKIIYIDEPDYPVRLAAARTITEFVSGKPIAMSVVANLTPGELNKSHDDFLGDLLKDRGAIDAMRETLAKMAEAAERVRPIDISASTTSEGADNSVKQPIG